MNQPHPVVREQQRRWRVTVGCFAMATLIFSYGAPDLDYLDETSSTRHLQSALSPCREMLRTVIGDREPWGFWDSEGGPVTYLEQTGGWLKVSEVVSPRSGESPATVRTEQSTGTAVQAVDSATGEAGLTSVDDFIPSIEFGARVGADVWLAVDAYSGESDNPWVMYAVIILPDGRTFFPGVCLHEEIYEGVFVTAYGDRADEEVAKMVGTSGFVLPIESW